MFRLKVGVKYVFIMNTDVENGLVNGVRRTLRHFSGDEMKIK